MQDEMNENTQVFSTAQYPQLEGLKEGDSIPKITHTGNRVQAVADGSVTVELGQCEFEIDNQADKAMKGMMGDHAPAGGKTSGLDVEY
jgi:hypothetical protein